MLIGGEHHGERPHTARLVAYSGCDKLRTAGLQTSQGHVTSGSVTCPFGRVPTVTARAFPLILPELARHGFRHVLFESGGEPLLQSGLLLGRHDQRAQPSTALIVVPANLGLNPEAKLLTGEREQDFDPVSRLQGRRGTHGEAALADIFEMQLTSVPSRSMAAGIAIGHRK